MGRLTVRLPDALHRQLESLAHSEGVSLNQYLVYALTRQATLDLQAKNERGTNQPPEKPARRDRQAGAEREARQQAESDTLLHLPSEDFPPPADN